MIASTDETAALQWEGLYSYSAMLVLVPCSSTKRAAIDPRLTVGSVRLRELSSFAKEWTRRVAAAPVVARASDLYGGVGVSSATLAAERLSCPVYFVSAGLSLVRASRQVPCYDLSVSNARSAPPAVAKREASAADWWDALNGELGQAHPIASLVRRANGPVLVALPAPYVRMVQHDLLAISAGHRAKLRLIIASNTPVPKELEAYTLRYDDRLSGLADAPGGANSYFAQRALAHFSLLLSRHHDVGADVRTHRRWIADALAAVVRKPTPRRTTQLDADILRWIKADAPDSARSFTALLRAFRDAGLACEQDRFRRLVEHSGRLD